VSAEQALERWRAEEAAKMQGKLVELPGNPTKRGGSS
jgi:hypothetical protein